MKKNTHKKSYYPKFKFSVEFISSIIFILSIVLIYLLFLILKPHQTLNQINNFSTFLKPKSQINTTATPSAQEIKNSPTPTPKPKLKPSNSGKSVRVPILTYHYIGNNPNPNDKARDNLSVTPDKFDEELNYLSKNGYQPITFDTLYAALKDNTTLPAKSVILTFDDGYIDFYINAYQILRKYGFHAVSFLPTGLVGTSYYMNWDQIREIDKSGLVSFQAHSVTHPNLVSLSDKDLQYQIAQSKKILQDNLGKTVNTFAYPFGTSDERTWSFVKNAGFFGAVGTWSDTTVSEGTIFDMPRVKVNGGMDLNTFASRL